jgi:transposase
MMAASADAHQRNQEETEMDATTVAVDIAKSVFELAIADARWHIGERKRLNRAQFARFLAETPATHVVMEACGTAHYWGRVAQQHGHRVTLVPPAYVRPYVRRNKTDRADAEAILESVRSGQMPTVPVKRVEQQALVAVHRIREQWMTTRTARINTVRGILREQGLLLPAGARAALQAVPRLLEEAETRLPNYLRQMLTSVHEEVRAIETRIADLERQLRVLADADPVVTRLRTVPGVGLLTATALVGTVGHIHAFRRARQFASWLGLTPREHSSGQRRRLGGISKRGDIYLRCLLTHGARSILVTAHRRRRDAQSLTRLHQWALHVQERRGHNKATIAVANKLGRIVWAVWHKDVPFELPMAV